MVTFLVAFLGSGFTPIPVKEHIIEKVPLARYTKTMTMTTTFAVYSKVHHLHLASV